MICKIHEICHFKIHLWYEHSFFTLCHFISETTKVKNILIVAYMRSGSTFTSKILEHGSNTPAFFSMEPLWQIYRKCHRRKKGVCCPDNTCRSVQINCKIYVLMSYYEWRVEWLHVSYISIKIPQEHGDVYVSRVVHSILYEPFAWKLPHLIQWLLIEILVFRSHD